MKELFNVSPANIDTRVSLTAIDAETLLNSSLLLMWASLPLFSDIVLGRLASQYPIIIQNLDQSFYVSSLGRLGNLLAKEFSFNVFINLVCLAASAVRSRAWFLN